jgi:2-polyprenyl-3-methyl-5-hydroxy-6-metoxy-1,4-benzoquinol methylase
MAHGDAHDANPLDIIAPLYYSEALGGLNEFYHIAVRDALLGGTAANAALELGCGSGQYTERLVELYARVDVVDGSLELLDKVVGRLGHPPHLHAHHSMAEVFLESTQREWDHIYLTFLLEHLENPISVMKAIKARLAPSGRVFIAVPNSRSVHRVLAHRSGLISSTEELSDNDVAVGHRRVYHADLLRDHLHAAGLRVLREQGVGLKPASLAQLRDLPQAVQAVLASSGDLSPGHAAYICVEAA